MVCNSGRWPARFSIDTLFFQKDPFVTRGWPVLDKQPPGAYNQCFGKLVAGEGGSWAGYN